MKLIGLVHLHSTHSYDGKLSLSEIRDLAVRDGISFVCMTEHTEGMDEEKMQKFIDECRSVSDDRVSFIPGFEITSGNSHTLAIGVSSPVQIGIPIEMMKKAKADGAWIVLAHPHRNQFEIQDAHLAVLDGIEIWNGQYDGKHVPRTAAVSYLSFLRRKLPKLLASAGLDLHRASHWGGPRIHLDIESVGAQASPRPVSSIVTGLKMGKFEIVRGSVHIPSDRPMPTVQRTMYAVSSAIRVGLIRMGKWVSSTASHAGLQLPKTLKENIRRWM
ncbi:hypothetical protein KBC54_00205 [Patescibacteria group bacterium]|nr:hypothetical protein [Patescibacteria group bacterium]